MIAAHDAGSRGSDPGDRLAGTGAIADDVAAADDFVVQTPGVACNGLQRFEVPVNVRENQTAHSRITVTSGVAPRRTGMATVPRPLLT